MPSTSYGACSRDARMRMSGTVITGPRCTGIAEQALEGRPLLIEGVADPFARDNRNQIPYQLSEVTS